MEGQIITVHVPKDQYRKFAKLAGQVNVPMQTILSQFVLDCVSDRWGTAEGTMAKDWFANHWWSAFERADFFGWLAQSNQLDEILQKDQNFAVDAYDALQPYLTTSMAKGQLVNEAWAAKDYTRLDTIKPDGTYQVGEDGFMEFYPDADALQQAVLQLFYEKVE